MVVCLYLTKWWDTKIIIFPMSEVFSKENLLPAINSKISRQTVNINILLNYSNFIKALY